MGSDTLLTLVEIAERTGLSRSTLTKYKEMHAKKGGQLDGHYRGEGRSMLFRPSSIPIFRELRDGGVSLRGVRP